MRTNNVSSVFLLFIFLFTSGMTMAQYDGSAHKQSVDQWKERRVSSLLKTDGWLSLAGLWELKEGRQRFGSAKDNELIFPDHVVDYLGVLDKRGDEVYIEAVPGQEILLDDKPVLRTWMGNGEQENGRIFTHKSLSWYLIMRAGKFMIRLKDSESAVLKNFHGIDYFDLTEEFFFKARFEAYTQPKPQIIPNIISGIEEQEMIPGAVVFEYKGKSYRIDALDAGESYFLIIGDATSGEETYGGGRFVYVKKPGEDGIIDLDFNKAYNPPCVFTPYATCPLPPAQNLLPFAIRAGEKSWGH